MISGRSIILVISFCILSWVGFEIYSYFFSTMSPELNILSIDEGGCYASDAQCIIKARDQYKLSTLSISLDSKPLVNNFSIGKILRKKDFEYCFTIPTRTLTNGKHILHVEVCSGNHNKAKTSKDINFIVDNIPLQAAFVKGDSDAKVFQGRTLHIQFQVNKELKSAILSTLSAKYICFPESDNSLVYECFIPIDCEANPNEYLFVIDITDRVGNTMILENKFQVVPYPFKKQTLKFDGEKIKLENETGLGENQFEEEILQCLQNSPKKKLWKGVFYPPTEIKEARQITTEFGMIRTSQERGLRQHKAIDIYNTPKSVLIAPQDGIVVLKGRYVHSGNTVVIDHGYGLLTLLFHLDTIAPLEIGQKIKKGNPVGTLGKTGYATGFHLHWEMRLGNVGVDPIQWTKL